MEAQAHKSNVTIVLHVVTTKSYFEVFKAPCNDEYCRSCLRELFETSYTDETLFPPRCCRKTIPIDGKDINIFLNKDIRDRYEPRRVEVETSDRTYCCKKTCSAFIPPNTIKNRDWALSRMQRAEHARAASVLLMQESVRRTQTKQQTLELAHTEGWRRCPKCKRLVELTIGCYHMT